MRREIKKTMLKIKMAMVAVLAVFALSATAAATASASWFVNGTELSKGQKVALANTAAVVTSGVLTLVTKAETVTIACTGSTLGVEEPEIIGTNEGRAKAVIIKGCATTKPATKCSLAKSEIRTEPVKTVFTKGSGETDIATLTPQSEEFFGVIPFSVTNACSFNEETPVYGVLKVKEPTGQTEEESQAMEGLGSVENNSLEVAKNKVYIFGSLLLRLLSLARWSFR